MSKRTDKKNRVTATMRTHPNAPSGLVRALIVAVAIVLTSVVMPLAAGAAADTATKPSGAAGIAEPRGSVPFGTYRIQNLHSHKCLDHFTDGPGTYGNWLGMFTCNTSPSEKWRLISSNVPAYPYLFQNVDSGLCISAPGFGDGDADHHYFMDFCVGDSLQTFETQVALSGGTFILFKNDPTGDADTLVDEYQTTCCVNGSPVGNFHFTNGDPQRWNFIAA